MAIETISIKDAADVTKNVLADLIGSDYGQVIKLAFGTDGTLTLVEPTVGLPVALLAGSNSIGTVVLGAGSALAGQVDLNSVPAASRTTDSISAVLATDAIMNNLTALTPKFAKANVTASSTDSNIVTAVGGKKIRVLSFRDSRSGHGHQRHLQLEAGRRGHGDLGAIRLRRQRRTLGGFQPDRPFRERYRRGSDRDDRRRLHLTGIGVTYVEV